MRTRALILFFPFTVFIAEMASFPSQVKNSCKKMSCMKMMKEMNCIHKKNNNSKKTSGECGNTSICSLCPVCSLFIMQAQYDGAEKIECFSKKYPSLTTNYDFSYIPSVWKPPNGYLRFS